MAAPITAVDPAPARLRHELKFPLAPGEDLELSRRLARLFPRDSHAGPGGSYRVTSLYFDTPSDRALREKVEGTGRREKFRLRYYGEDTGRLRLEKKFKAGSLCGKRGVPLGREEALRLLGGDWGWLLDPGDPLLVELYSKLRGQLLRPAAVVCYDREAFRFPPGNVRVTLDRRIRAGRLGEGFLEPERLRLPAAAGVTVLEVKYDGFLPEVVRLAVQLPARQSACSKYALCRRFD